MTTSYLISDFVQALQDLQKTAVGEKARADSAAVENKKLQMAVAKRDEEISALKKSGNRSVLRKKLTEALARAEKAEKSLSQQYLSQYYPYYSWFAAF